MPKIFELDQHVADLIAAGEVVERPASVVKELLENSIDAGAKVITVEIQAGGLTFIRVTDNGCGIAPEDVATAFVRHATSKLRGAEGLEAIGTLGFRGEALAAIAAVSRIGLLTREPGSAEGVSLSLEAGLVSDISPAGCPEGTTIIVRDLFFNTPARQKFMKTDRAESSAIASAVLRSALSRPDVSIRFVRDGKAEYHTPGDSRVDSCIYSLLGREFSAGLVPAESSDESLSVTGFVSSPAAARGNRSHQFFFVNGRPIQSRTLQAALEQAFANTLPSGRYPSCVLYITTSFGAVDVNVHPAKSEVKFVSDKQVFDGVYYAALSAISSRQELREESGRKKDESGNRRVESYLGSVDAEPGVSSQFTIQDQHSVDGVQGVSGVSDIPGVPGVPGVPDVSGVSGIPGVPGVPPMGRGGGFRSMDADEYRKQYGTGSRGSEGAERGWRKDERGNRSVERYWGSVVTEPGVDPQISIHGLRVEDAAPGVPQFRVIGEALKTYIIVEYRGSVWFIDKHAAHERIHFDALKRADFEPMSQSLIAPVVCRHGQEDASILLDNAELLEGLGFAVDSFGEGAVAVRRIPSDIDIADTEQVLSDICEQLRLGGTPTPAQRDDIYRAIACKAAIKAGKSSEKRELEALTARVLSGEVAQCPHGRPVAFEITKATLDRGFKRA